MCVSVRLYRSLFQSRRGKQGQSYWKFILLPLQLLRCWTLTLHANLLLAVRLQSCVRIVSCSSTVWQRIGFSTEDSDSHAHKSLRGVRVGHLWQWAAATLALLATAQHRNCDAAFKIRTYTWASAPNSTQCHVTLTLYSSSTGGRLLLCCRLPDEDKSQNNKTPAHCWLHL